MSQDTSLWDNTHRAFLQALLAKQTFTFEEARPLLAKIQTANNPARPVPENDIVREDFIHYIQELNNAISAFDFEIRSTVHQTRQNEEVWALVNTTSDAMTQMSTSHSADEIAYVKKVLDYMFETNNTQRAEIMAVPGREALNLARESVRRQESGTQAAPGSFSLTQSQAEKVLNSMTNEGWFEESPRGFFSLSPRALMELRGWLLDTYNDQPPADDDSEEEEVQHQKIKFCAACKSIITVGQRCPDTTCPARLHSHCAVKMWAAQGRREECPTCKTPWRDPGHVGEKAAKRVGQRGASSGRVGNSRSKRRSPNAHTDGADHSDDE